MNILNELTKSLIEFRNERDWEQFHNPKDLALAISIESSELLELFLWKRHEEVQKEKIEEEVADILSFLLLFSEKYHLDLAEVLKKKIAINKLKYPVEKSKGSSKKYNEL